MKRSQVIRRLHKAANEAGLDFKIEELKRHTGVTVGGKRSTLGRHSEIDEVTVGLFFDQFAEVLGKGWWR